MPDTAQTIINQTAQAVSQSWISRIFIRKISVKEKQAYASQLNELFSNISQAHFEQFADASAKQSNLTQNEASKDQKKQEILADIFNHFKEGIFSYLGNPSAQDITQAMIDYYIAKNIQRDPLFSTFSRVIDILRATFPQNKEAVLEMIRIQDVISKEQYLSEVSYLIQSIAYILQSIAIDAPKHYYNYNSSNLEVKVSLENTLKAVNIIRLRCSLMGGNTSLHSLNYALCNLNRELARVDDRVWLPFKPLVMAPLTLQEDLQLYARDRKEVEIFANRIDRNGGVFLITGYRGVGKSTFIYEALSLLTEKQKDQSDDDHWRIVPISISLAKASGITNILRLCIRRLFDTFLKETDERSDVISSLTNGVEKLLTHKEKDHLTLAYLRATWKVNIQRDDNMKALKQLGLDGDMSIKVSNFFAPTIGNVIAGTFPSFGISGKISKEWSKAMGSTVALPDYDEDKAEDDIVRFIRMLATQEKIRNNTRMKLVFIFDEMDKMSEEEQEELIKQLKNLFLERHSVFLLVTSKGFYYRWWDKRNVEDDVLTSYFSWIQTIPLFTSAETALLLRNLILLDASKNLSEEEKEFVDTLAKYLTYHARGIPRDIMRELQSVQLWLEDSPQTYMENRMGKYPAIHVYAELQNILEGLFDYTNAATSMQAASISTSATVDNTVITEHTWANEGRKEQVKRGLYVLMEELLEQGSMVLNLDLEVLKRIREDNFKMITSHSFKNLLDDLVMRLQGIRLNVGPDTPLAFHYPEYTDRTKLELFAVGNVHTENHYETTAKDVQKIVVLPEFYSITGRSRSITSDEISVKGNPLSQEKIEVLLKSTDNWQQQRAIGALQDAPHPFSQGVSDQLCHLFLSAQNIQTRRSIINLQDESFFNSVHRVGDEALNSFIDTETDEQLIQEFIRLVRGYINENKNDKIIIGTPMLLRLLHRQKKATDRKKLPRTPAVNAPLSNINFTQLKTNGTDHFELPERLLIDIISILATMDNEDDVLSQVMQSLNVDKDIPNTLLRPLKTLEEKSKHSLVELIVSLDFNAISLSTVRTILEGKNNQLLYLWEQVLTQREKAAAKQVLVVLVQQIMKNFRVDETNKIVEWVNDSLAWDDIDRYILSQAQKDNPKLLFPLQTVVSFDKQERLPIAVNLPPPSPIGVGDPSQPSPARAASESSIVNGIIGIISILFIIAIPILVAVFFKASFWSVWLMVTVGLLTGFLASRVIRGGGYGPVGDLLVGYYGAFLGGLLANHFMVTNLWITCLVAYISACFWIAIMRASTRRHTIL